MIKVLFLILSISIFAINGYASTNENTSTNQDIPHHPVIPMLLGAGLITWGAYELGSDPSDGRRNIAILWGGALVASAGIVLFQSTKDKSATLSLSPTKNRTPALVFNYDF